MSESPGAAEPDSPGNETTARPKRAYTKRARAFKEAETHAKIIRATLELWVEHGPAATTISAVAARAKVQRLTVYRHFPDEDALARAARARLDELLPLPDPGDWAAVRNPAKRMRRAFRALYRYYEKGQPLLIRLQRDADRTPALSGWSAEQERYLDGVLATLDADWPVRPKRATSLSAAIALAIRFEAWRSLAQSGLKPGPAARLMERMIRGLAR
jgi:AcrR family transcriptional regulator